LIVTGDDALLDDLLGLVALSGREPRVVPDASMAGPAWAAAPLVLVGTDALPSRPPLRRPGVLLVGRGTPTSDLWRDAVRIGAEDVLDTTHDAVALRALIEASAGAIGAPVVAVAGAAGGLGATTLASVVARRAVDRGSRVLLIDLAPEGGGLDLALGAEDVPGARWSDLDPLEGVIDPAALLGALPCVDDLVLLSGDREGDPPDEAATVQLLQAARRGVDLVVVDAARSWWPALSWFGAPDPVGVLLAPADLCGAAAGRRAATAFGPWVDDLRLVVRTGRGRTAPADQVADAVGLPLLAALPDDARAPSAREQGRMPSLRGRSPWSAVAQRILDAVLLDAGPR
jgi:secretion/DNA translocation related CpaE-like protein